MKFIGKANYSTTTRQVILLHARPEAYFVRIQLQLHPLSIADLRDIDRDYFEDGSTLEMSLFCLRMRVIHIAGMAAAAELDRAARKRKILRRVQVRAGHLSEGVFRVHHFESGWHNGII
jgi:hypothetical protein